MAMGNPNFHNLEEIPQMLADDDKQYNIYAEICMNFVETIYDSALHDEDNRVTYAPTVISQIKLHRQWFLKYNNKNRFKKSFRHFVEFVSAKLNENEKSYEQICENITQNMTQTTKEKK